MRLNSIHLVILSWHYYRPDRPFDGKPDPATTEAYADLFKEEMLKRGEDGVLHTTKRGHVFVNELLQTPLPVASWVIPEKGK